MDGKYLVEKLIAYAEEFLHLKKLDVVYTRNLLLREFGCKEPMEGADVSAVKTMRVPDELVAETERYALEDHLCEEGEENLYSTYIMGILTPKPSEVNEAFFRLRKEEGIKAACAYFYDLCIKNNYIQKTAVDRNLKWQYKDGDNILEITINLSKPEKDPKAIAAAKLAPQSAYPKCQLCAENEGYAGRMNHPARENHRIIPLTINGSAWNLQYSPYVYYNEHCIVFNSQHTPMKIERATFRKLLDFVGLFPHYFVGSNADLPIVGGSILSHSHFQGGRYVFPMQKAHIAVPLRNARYTGVKAGIVNWPVSTVRLVGRSSQEVQNAADDILRTWRDYSDTSVDIIAHTGDTPHNTVTPILHYDENDGYILDLALRNNRTTEQYPDGIFHPHKEYHNIKKENIGLIEVMGLAILPARLKDQSAAIADILTGSAPNTSREAGSPLAVHADWIDGLIKKYGTGLKREKAEAVLRDEIGIVFSHVLENAGVFKQDAAGQAAFLKFMESVGYRKA